MGKSKGLGCSSRRKQKGSVGKTETDDKQALLSQNRLREQSLHQATIAGPVVFPYASEAIDPSKDGIVTHNPEEQSQSQEDGFMELRKLAANFVAQGNFSSNALKHYKEQREWTAAQFNISQDQMAKHIESERRQYMESKIWSSSEPLANFPAHHPVYSITPEQSSSNTNVKNGDGEAGDVRDEACAAVYQKGRVRLDSLKERVFKVKDKISNHLGGVLSERLIWYSMMGLSFAACSVITGVTHGVGAPVFAVFAVTVQVGMQEINGASED